MRYRTQRLGQAIFTLFSVITLSFVLIRALPGGPEDYLKAKLAQSTGGQQSQQQLAAMAQTYFNLQPQKPLWEQYVSYVTSMATGNLGKSVWYHKPVSAMLAQTVPWTVFVMATAVLLTFSIGILLGAVMAYNENGRFDLGTTIASVVLTSTPYYLFALILLFLFAYNMSIFPTGGRIGAYVTVGFNPQFVRSALMHAALPIFSIVLTEFGGWALSMRGNSIRILGEDYLRVARLRGIAPNRIAIRYVGQNAILPMYTGLMISIGFIFGGSVILEQIFSYPGIGYYLLRAVKTRDYPLMMGGFITITAAVVIGILVADLTYGMIDPRASGGESRESY